MRRKGGRERERDRDTETERQRQRDRQTDRDRQRQRDRDTDRETETERGRGDRCKFLAGGWGRGAVVGGGLVSASAVPTAGPILASQ